MAKTSDAALGPQEKIGFALAAGLTFSALIRRGAFTTPDTMLVTGGLVACLAISLGKPRKRDRWLLAVLPFPVAWYALDLMRGGIDRSSALAGAVIATACGIVIARRAGPLISVDAWLLAIASAVNAAAVTGWLLRVDPIALVFDERYRLAGTMAYPNAAGLFAAVSLVLAATATSSNVARQLSCFVASAALFGSLSRGSIVIAVVGVALSSPARRTHLLPGLVAGAAIAAWGIGTSARGDVQIPHLLVFVGIGGLIVWTSRREGAGLSSLRRYGSRAVIAAGLVIGLLLLPKATEAAQTRFSSASVEDRSAEWDAALDAGMRHPVTGSGPERDLIIENFRGLAIARYAHNEFLQVFAGGGLLGLATLALSIGAIGYAVVRDRRRAEGTVAVVVMVLLGAAIDFPWHFVGLLGFVGLCLGRRRPIA